MTTDIKFTGKGGTTYSLLECSKCGGIVKAWFEISHSGGESLDAIHQQFLDLPIKIVCANCVNEMTGTNMIEDRISF